MRVAIDARGVSSEHRGVGRTVVNLLLGLSQRSSDLEYVVFFSDPYLPLMIKRVGGQYKGRFDWIQVRSSVGSISERVEIPWLVRLHRIDLFHDIWGVGPNLRRARSVATIHELEFLHFKDSSYRSKRIRKLLRRAQLVVALNEAVAGELELELHISRPKIRIVPGGIHPRFFERSTEEEIRTMRNRFGLSGDFFLCVSGNRESKNLAMLSEVWKPDTPLVLALSWDQIEKQQNDSAEVWRAARDSGAVRFLGTVEDVWLKSLYATSKCLIVPSLYEGFSLAAAEALACSCVPVLSDIPSHRNIFDDLKGIEAIFFDPKKNGELAAAVGRVYNAGPSLKMAVLEKFRDICHRYAVTEVADRMQKVYREAAEL